MAPIVLLFLILGIGESAMYFPQRLLLIRLLGASLGSQTAYAINPARDLGPRLILWMAGYGTELWTAYNWYWIWYVLDLCRLLFLSHALYRCPITAPICGGLVGGFLYDLFLYKG